MTQYPEKSNQWDARFDVMSQLSGIPLDRFFRILSHIVKPEFGETGLWKRWHICTCAYVHVQMYPIHDVCNMLCYLASKHTPNLVTGPVQK